MGKNKKKNDEKKAALQARKEAKADKAAKKRLAKEAKKSGSAIEDDNQEENLDDLLELYRRKDKEVNTTTFETLDGFPPRRANASFTLDEQEKSGHVYLFGGEYYDGVENIVLNDLLRWDPSKEEWKQIFTPKPHPAPRCAHSCIFYKNSLFVFGGEMATADQYHHYKDIWRFDLTTNKWEEIQPRNTGTPPTPRSGHTAFVWKHFMVIFGGFYEALHETRWFNDTCVLDLQTFTWLAVPYSKLATRPEPRSACNIGLNGDIAYIQGGFSKLKNPTAKAETKVHTDAWMLHLKPILQGNPPTWERLTIRGGGMSPKDRAGTASISYKGRMLVYGGVVDQEQYHHKVDSVFYNDLFAFDMERRKWFPLRARPQQANEKKSRRRKKEQQKGGEEWGVETVTQDDDENDEEESDLELEEMNENETAADGWDLDMLRSNMFAFIDGDGNIVYEKIEEEEKKQDDIEGGPDEEKVEEEEEEEKEEEKEEDQDEDEDEDEDKMEEKKKVLISKNAVKAKIISSSEVMTMNEDTGAPEAVSRSEPLPRINAGVLVRNHILFIYGGILEVGNREVTLDDCWSFDLRKRERWECIFEGTIHKQVWRGAVHDDDDSYISTGTGGDMSDDDSDDDEFIDVGEMDEERRREAKAAKKLAKMEKKQVGLKQEINELRATLDLDDVNRTPQLEGSVESMADFYSRTSEFWTTQAAETVANETSRDDGQLINKELKREGFTLAQKRYDELRPFLDRLLELTLQQREAESGKKERKGEKKDKEKKKKKKSKS